MSRLRDRLRAPTRSEVVLGALIGAFVWVFGQLCFFHQRYFGNFSFDLGIYDQGIWLLSQGDTPFVTVRGLHLFGHHTNFILLAWAPFYRLFGAGAGFLVVSEVVIVGLAAIPVFLLARDRLRERDDDRAGLLAVLVAAAFLLNPGVQNELWWTFHPDTISILPVLMTWLFATRRRWRATAVWGVIALLCKEDVSLTLAAMGVVVAYRCREPRALYAGAASAGWFVLMTRVVMTAANHGLDPFYVQEFSHLGSNLGQMVTNSVLHPSRWLWRTDGATGIDGRYWFQLAAPFGLLPLLVGPELLMIVPQFFINSVTSWPYAADARYHYSALPIAVLTICTVELLGRLPSRLWRRGVVVALVGGALLTNFWWAPSPLGPMVDDAPVIGRWLGPDVPAPCLRTPTGYLDSQLRGDPFCGAFRRNPHPHQAAAEEAMRRIPADASVAAVFYLVPQLTHRREIYEFPTPFMRFNYRVPGHGPPDGAVDDLDYVLLDDNAWYDPSHAQLYMTLLAPGSGFETVFAEDHIVLLRRTADPISDAVRAYAAVGL